MASKPRSRSEADSASGFRASTGNIQYPWGSAARAGTSTSGPMAAVNVRPGSTRRDTVEVPCPSLRSSSPSSAAHGRRRMLAMNASLATLRVTL